VGGVFLHVRWGGARDRLFANKFIYFSLHYTRVADREAISSSHSAL